MFYENGVTQAIIISFGRNDDRAKRKELFQKFLCSY